MISLGGGELECQAELCSTITLGLQAEDCWVSLPPEVEDLG